MVKAQAEAEEEAEVKVEVEVVEVVEVEAVEVEEVEEEEEEVVVVMVVEMDSMCPCAAGILDRSVASGLGAWALFIGLCLYWDPTAFHTDVNRTRPGGDECV